MSKAVITETVFGPEVGLTLRDKLGNSIGIFGGEPELVRLRVKGVAARMIGEMQMHPSQQMTPREGSRAEVTMSVAVNAELERWILGWGEQIEVIEPANLRERIGTRLEEAASLYRSPVASLAQSPQRSTLG